MLPTVSDHAAVQYLGRILEEDVTGTKARLEAQNPGAVITEGTVLQYMLGIAESKKLKAEIAHMCSFDFDPPGGHPVLITTDTCNFLIKEGSVVTVLFPWQTCSEKYATVLEKRTRGRNLGRMHIQPDPITERELQLARKAMEQEMPWRAPAALNGRHP